MSIDPRPKRAAALLLLAATLILTAGYARGQEPAATKEPSIDDSIDAAESELPRHFTKWNDFEGPYVTLHYGGAAMFEYSAFDQDAASKQQFPSIHSDFKWRDARILFNGTFPKVPSVTWKAGWMYDGTTRQYFMRESGLIVKVPKAHGYFFIGRTKEGFSLAKQMIGFAVWGIERQPMSDASIPIMADGIRWMGYVPNKHVLWNLGLFNNSLSEYRHYPYYQRQAVARVAWVPVISEKSGSVLHIGASVHIGDPQDGKIQFKARPEDFIAPYFVDSGTFAAKRVNVFGSEIYYRNKGWTVGSEGFMAKVDAPESGNPTFHGADFMVAWVATGETRPYVTRGGVFGFVKPTSSLFSGGIGAIEPIFRLSYINMNSGTIHGGKMWRVTPIVAWHLNDAWTFKVGYGYGELDRFGVTGKTQYYQTRLQLQF